MYGYFLHNNHLLQIDVSTYHFKPMRNPLCAKYRSIKFKIIWIRNLDTNELTNQIDEFINLKFYNMEVDYYYSEQQIFDGMKKDNGYFRDYYANGILKEKYFIKNGNIVEETRINYDENGNKFTIININ